MNLRHLETIVEIRRCGSFSAAARRLEVSQPALSRSIARLEADLGAAIVERLGGAARLTALGKHLADRGETLLAAMAALRREVEVWSQGETGRLRIGVGPVTRLKPLPQVIEQLAATFPRLAIETRQVSGAALVRAVQQGRYDLAFSFHGNAAEFGDLIRIKIFEDRQAVVARVGHPILTLAAPTLDAMLGYPMAGFGTNSGLGDILPGLGAAARSNLDAFVSDDAELIRTRPLHSDMLSRAPRFVFAEMLDRGLLVEVPMPSDTQYECWMLTTPGQWQSPLIQAVARIAKDASAGLAMFPGYASIP